MKGSRVYIVVFSILLDLSNAFAVPAPAAGTNDGSEQRELIGDLVLGNLSPVGQIIADIITGSGSGQSQEGGEAPRGDACKKDPCCIWYAVSETLTKNFKGHGGRCNDNARAAVRAGFHDAGTWSKSNKAAGKDFGGADGSLVMNFGEDARPENNGLQGIIALLRSVQAKHGVGFADLVQFASTHATVTCPLGPRVRTFVGRKDATQAAPDGLLPSMKSPAPVLIDLFKDKTIIPHDLAALVGAHSTSKQFTQDLTRVGASQDSTPAVWDVRFYNETIQSPPRKKLFVFPSDVALSNDPRIRSEWLSFIDDQSHWNEVIWLLPRCVFLLM